MKCLICQTDFTTNHQLATHLRRIHKLTTEKYYKLYIDAGKCKICNAQCKFISLNSGFNKTCSPQCKNKLTSLLIKSTSIQEKIKQTNLKKYGTKCPLQNTQIQEKTKQTNLKKYGVEHPLQNKQIQEKIKQTNLKKYGTKCPLQNTQIQEKTKQTNLKKYNTMHPMQNKQIQEKIKQTNLKKYGVENSFQIQFAKEKTKQTNLKKYGVEHPLQNKQIQEKIKQTNLKKYGVENSMQLLQFKRKSHFTKKKNNSYGKSKSEDRCFKYIKKFIDPLCQRQIFVKKWNIDFYLPSFNIFIQFDGEYWHGHTQTKKQLSNTQQGKHILKMIEMDKEQNKTIPNLIRITDKEFFSDKTILLKKINLLRK